MVLREPSITRRSKVPDSTRSESSKQKPRSGKRKRPKRQINIEQNNRLDRTSFRALQARYDDLQRQEDDLLLRIGEAKKPGPTYFGGKNNKTLRHSPNPQTSQLPLLQSHLKDIRHEKDQVRKQLEKAQR